MFLMSKKFIALIFLLMSLLFAASEAIAKDVALYFDFNSIPSHQLIDTINMRFVTSSQFTVIQWNLKKGAKLPVHSHLNEQVIRVLEGNIEVHTEDQIYNLHAGDVMIFPPYVTHGFIATQDAVMYEQQTPIRQDFLQPDFIEKLSEYLRQNQ
jgi:quercetin dioxygenase-like cupin family protein